MILRGFDMNFADLVASGLSSLTFTPVIHKPKNKVKKATGSELMESVWNDVDRHISEACHLKVRVKANGKRAKKRDRIG